MRYAIVIEQANGNYSAYAPDLPGCIATGNSVAALEIEMERAIAFHIAGMREDGQPVPLPASTVRYIDVAVPS